MSYGILTTWPVPEQVPGAYQPEHRLAEAAPDRLRYPRKVNEQGGAVPNQGEVTSG
jgi:hypothetical protein